MRIRGRRRQGLVNLWLKLSPLKTADGVFIARRSVLGQDVEIGSHTRINGPTFVRGLGALRIGSFCAIAHQTRFITTNHAMTGVSLQNRLRRELGLKTRSAEKRDVVIGHDVWIGDAALFLPGVNVGNGAVIGAGAVVTRDVEHYAVYAGNPAKKIGDRFPDEVKAALEGAAWWEWSPADMKSARALFDAELSALPTDEAVALIERYAAGKQGDAA